MLDPPARVRKASTFVACMYWILWQWLYVPESSSTYRSTLKLVNCTHAANDNGAFAAGALSMRKYFDPVEFTWMLTEVPLEP